MELLKNRKAKRALAPRVKANRAADVRGERRAPIRRSARMAVLEDVRSDIDRAVSQGERIRAEIQARIEKGLHARGGARSKRAPKRRR